MEWETRVEAFFEKAGSDHRISPVHVSLYVSLLVETFKTDMELIIPVKDFLMKRAKISSTVTYHRCLKELHEYGYIEYRPSFASRRTRIRMIEIG